MSVSPEVTTTPSTSVASSGKSQRDNFTEPTKRLLAQRVGWLCSNPECTKPTVGPQKGGPGTMNIGVAAHITAAAEGFARYDARLTPEERKAADNGIWLCSDHAHQIDHDEKAFRVELLHKWKKDAEERAFAQLLTGGRARVEPMGTELADALGYLRKQFGLPRSEDLPALLEKVRSAAQRHIETFTQQGPAHAVSLYLTAASSRGKSFTHVEMAAALRSCGVLDLVAEPGQGKSTTLVQLGARLLESGPLPLLVPLAEVGQSVDDLFSWVVGRQAFAGIRSEHLKFLAAHGEIAFLLDGWNEVTPVARLALIKTMRALRREFPLLVICITTRPQAAAVPFVARTVHVESLSDEQQEDLASRHGSVGQDLLDRVRRTSGVRDLARIPFYLQALLQVGDAGALPTTKEGTISLLVKQHEDIPERAEQLRQSMLGQHRRYLGDLAVAMMQARTTALDDTAARQSLRASNTKLLTEGLVQNAPEPASVLETLVATHVLVHGEGDTYAFQHQQFQEWYAAGHVEAMMRDLPKDAGLESSFAQELLDDRLWEEAILFACERLAVDESGVAIVARAVRLAMSVGPMLAAEIVYRTGGAVWSLVSPEVQAFARSWHQGDQVDLAVGFMMKTGRGDFADLVWPLVSNSSEQIQSEALHIGDRLRPSVFGVYLQGDYEHLQERVRERLVSGLIFGGGIEALETAFDLAKRDPSVEVKSEAVEALLFRGAPRQATSVLDGADNEVWRRVAERDYFDGLTAPPVLTRLRALQDEDTDANASPARNLVRFTRKAQNSGEVADLDAILRNEKLDLRADHTAAAFHQAAGAFPEVVAAAMTDRILTGSPLPFRVQGYLSPQPVSEAPELATIAIDSQEIDERTGGALFLSGPGIIARMISEFLELKPKIYANGMPSSAQYAPLGLLRDKISGTRPDAFVEAIVSFSAMQDHRDIEALADLITVHGKHGTNERMDDVPAEGRRKLVEALNGWADCLMRSGPPSRHDMAEVVDAMRRVPDSSQMRWVSAFLREDLKQRDALKELAKGGRNQEALNEWRNSHAHSYRQALYEIGADDAYEVAKSLLRHPEFGHDAAIALRLIAMPSLLEKRANIWPDLDRAQAARERRSNQPDLSLDATESILDVAEELAASEPPYGRAVALAAIAVVMPHIARPELMSKVAGLEVMSHTKLDLFNGMIVGGLLPSADLVLQEFRKVLAEKENRWWDDRTSYAIFSWLKVLPNTDRPTSVFDALALVPEKNLPRWQIRDILPQLRLLGVETKAGMLREFALRFPDMLSEHEWFGQVQKLGFRPAMDLFLEGVEGDLGKGFDLRTGHFLLPEQLAYAMADNDMPYLFEKLAAARSDGAKQLVFSVLLKTSSVEGLIAAAQSPVGRQTIRRQGARGVQDMIYSREPHSPDGTSYELRPRNASEFRRKLFALTVSHDKDQAAFAVDYLTRIDMIRQEDGATLDEPRHPDIQSGRPWPQVAPPH
ncbi:MULTISPECIES: NACHT domain-containing protein [Rhizobium]|uniref:HNH endonuclease n=1 Tax=Rhizobium leguminosarum bv. viciae TaxID=387 RepID=A0A8G2MPF2_RHILV|nr:HNH endonuclease [Rhizobium leguminosarum]NKK05260.1 HNH endonuclease [Rhizobium leguminosarum bv. viciae]NKK24071.1 HNH endonuclease [Rhizobium leguminosarum bv. viciae]TBX92562.1 HNH endonuclease [Rhizobium leguminosarum bv. viciae]TBZ12329.1 HNH endonuclease [Rhizobium leguminosarum bv. viciae]UIK18526.1 HNH endonuclease [Rhizobium leguminosarum]